MSPIESRVASTVLFSSNEIDFSSNLNLFLTEIKDFPDNVIYICGTRIAGDLGLNNRIAQNQRKEIKVLSESIDIPIFSWTYVSLDRLAGLVGQNGSCDDKLAFYRKWVLTSGHITKVIVFENDYSPETEYELQIAKDTGIGIYDLRNPIA